jgi:hypothetical protein
MHSSRIAPSLALYLTVKVIKDERWVMGDEINPNILPIYGNMGF